MAEIDYAQGGTPAPERANLSTLVNIAGAVMSLALLVGVGIWGYKLLARDVTGVPVVRAVEGPMRIQPAEPGGEPADHQGLAVNDVAARGSAAAPADRLVLAPQPVRLMDEDQPSGEVATEAAVTETPAPLRADPGVAALVEQLTEGVEPMLPSGDDAPTPVVALLEQPLLTEEDPAEEPETPPADPETAADPDPAPEEDQEDIAVAIVDGPGVARSLRPRVRPDRSDVATVDPVAAVVSSVLDVDPDTLPAGTRLAQLGAYDSAEVARTEWDRINGRFADYMEGKQRVIQKASSGGRTFYRLRAMGFEDLSDARRFCAVLVADNADCIPVTTR